MGVCSHLGILRVISPAVISGMMLGGCVSNYSPGTDLQAVVATKDSSLSPNYTDKGLIPAGYGSMKQEDIALHVSNAGVMVRFVPLDESVIRVLLPDSYKSLHDLKDSYAKRISQAGRRYGSLHPSVWYISFFGIDADSRFAPQDVTVSSAGRDFRAFDFIPLTTGFGDQRVRQRETHSAIYIFDGAVLTSQPLTVSYQGVKTDSWDAILQQIERERAMILARASKANTQ